MLSYASIRIVDPAYLCQCDDCTDSACAAPDEAWSAYSSADSRSSAQAALFGVGELLHYVSCGAAAGGFDYAPSGAVRLCRDGWAAYPSSGLGDSFATALRLWNACGDGDG